MLLKGPGSRAPGGRPPDPARTTRATTPRLIPDDPDLGRSQPELKSATRARRPIPKPPERNGSERPASWGIATVSKGKTTTQRSRRINRRAVIILVGLLLTCGGFAGLKVYRDSAGARTYLTEAHKLVKEGKPAYALGHLNRYLEVRPNDLGGDPTQGRRSSPSRPTTPAQVNETERLLSQAIDNTPKGPDRTELRKKLVRLLLRAGTFPGQSIAQHQAEDLIQSGQREGRRVPAAPRPGP